MTQLLLPALLVLAMSPGAAAGVPYSAEILRDARGVPTIVGARDADVVYGMMRAQAADDYARVERNYLVALGRLAEVEGERALASDVRQRLWIDEAELRRLDAASPGWLKALNRAWAAALNDHLAAHPALRPAIARWEPWMALAFSEGSIGGDIESVDLAGIRAAYLAGAERVALLDPFPRGRDPQGSNGIALAPGRSRDGRALLLINPHTSFAFRSEAQLVSRAGLHVHGASTWGQYFVYQGWNRDLGWMHTSTGADNVDEYRVRLTRDGRHYRHGAALRPVRTRTMTLRVREPDGRLTERRVTTLATHHGPVTRREADGALVATALMHRPLAALEQSWLRTKATGLADYLRIAGRRANSSNNTILATRAGDIAHLMPQYMPRRDPRFDWTRPVDGNDPATDARGLHALGELPSLINPRSGFVQNSNDAPWHAGGPDSLSAADYPAYMDRAGPRLRGLNALAQLADGRRHDLDSLRAIAFNTALPGFDRLLPPLFAAYDALPPDDPQRAALAAPMRLLRGWDRRWSGDSAALTLAHRWGTLVWDAAGPAPTEAARYAATTALPPARLLGALDEAAARLRREWGSEAVPWRRVNCWQLPATPFERRFDDAGPCVAIPFASGQWGSYAVFSPHAAPGQRRHYGVHGNSYVATIAFGLVPEARAVMVGGQSSAPGSAHAGDQIADYAAGRLRPVAWSEAAARRAAVSRTVVP